MKKLMIAAAIVCAAAVSQAAQFNWSLDSKLFGVDAASVTGNGSIAASTTSAARNNGTWSWVLEVYDASSGNLLDSASGTFASIPMSGKATTGNFELADVGEGVEVTYIMTITGQQTDLRGRGIDGGKNYSNAILTSADLTGTLTTESMGVTAIGNSAPATWTVSGVSDVGPVPEPTSGLLLLLGVAGLALKRKQA